MHTQLSSVILGLFIIAITSLLGCGGEDGSLASEGVNTNDVGNEGVNSNGVSNNDGNNNGVTDQDVRNDEPGNTDATNGDGGGSNGATHGTGGSNGVGPSPKATLSWNPVKHYRSVTYTVHFGKQSSGQAGSCNYERSGNVSKTQATVTGLDPNTLYFFAVSAFDGDLRSQCSNEVSKLTR